MQTYDTLVLKELADAVQTKVEHLRDTLEQNPECRVEFTRGQINALRLVLDEMIAEASEAAQQRNR